MADEHDIDQNDAEDIPVEWDLDMGEDFDLSALEAEFERSSGASKDKPKHEPGEGGASSEELAELEAKLAEAESRSLRALADFQNFQRRAANNEAEAKKQGIASVLFGLLPVMDNFDLTLGQDISSMSAEQLMGGVEIVRNELLRALETQGVTTIKPEKGDPFDPEVHEAVSRYADGETEPGCVIEAFQTGYKLGDRVLRPAKVVVAEEGEPAKSGRGRRVNVIAHGVDLVEVARIAQMIERHGERFLQRCFTLDESAYARSARPPRDVERFAARFAAKEAAFKALGTGWKSGIAWTDAEVRLLPSGEPKLYLSGRATEIAAQRGIGSMLVSLSHTDTHALASVVAVAGS